MRREASNLPAATISTVISAESSLSSEASSLAAEAATLSLGRHAVSLSGDVGSAGLLLAVIPLGVEEDGLTFVQALESLSVDGAEVDEDILSSVVGGDEPEPLFGVEELDGSLLGHFAVV